MASVGFTQAYSQTVLDAQLASGDYYAWSENGTSESAHVARTAVSAWAAATAADPSVKANNGALTSAAASSNCIVTHFAVYSASTSGTQKTEWTPLTPSGAVAYPFTALASTDVLTAPGSSYTEADTVMVQAIAGVSLPTGISENTLYYCKTVSGATTKLSATSGGTAIDLTGDGGGRIIKVQPVPLITGGTIAIASGALGVSLT